MTALEEAQNLRTALLRSLGALHRDSQRKYSENEVQFRRDGVECVLVMALHDVEGMIKDWEPKQK